MESYREIIQKLNILVKLAAAQLADGKQEAKMEKELNEIKQELSSIKKLMILGLQNKGIQANSIAKALGISPGRLSQIAAIKKYKK